MGAMRLLLVRHGQTPSNVAHQLDTARPGAELTSLGRAQAAAVPEALAAQDIDAIYTSTLTRTQQTAEPLARDRGLQPRVRDGVREITAGDYEMCSDEESVHAYLDIVFGWSDDADVRVPGGETGREVLARVDEVVAEAAAEVGDGTAVIVAHGAVIRFWVGARADNVDSVYAREHWLPNTGLVAVEGDPATGWTVTRWTEQALGGERLTDEAHTGPGGERD